MENNAEAWAVGDVNWEIPYIPPEGVVRECLLPDGCVSCDDPIMRRPLEPLARFDRLQLKRIDGVTARRDPLDALRRVIAKDCAGLAHEHRPSVKELREAFASGRFTEQHRIALGWAFSGMRVKRVFPGLIAGAQLSIFEVARCFWTVFDGASFGCGPWLNQWADDPDRPHPSVKSMLPARTAKTIPV